MDGPENNAFLVCETQVYYSSGNKAFYVLGLKSLVFGLRLLITMQVEANVERVLRYQSIRHLPTRQIEDDDKMRLAQKQSWR